MKSSELSLSLLDERINRRMDRIRSLVIDGEQLSASLILCDSVKHELIYAKYYGPSVRRTPILESPRPVGSTLKIALYSAFLDRFPLPLATTYIDYEISVFWQGKTIRPRNSDNRFRGEVTLEYGFANSINTIAIQIVQQLGVINFMSYLRRCGLTCPLPNTPLLALGPIPLTGFELLATISPIVNGGRLCWIAPSELNASENEQLISDYTIQMMQQLLRATCLKGTGKYLSTFTENLFGGKTGTSENCKDLWFVGLLTNSLYGLVWIGKLDESKIQTNDGQPASASRFAVPLWSEILGHMVDRLAAPN